MTPAVVVEGAQDYGIRFLGIPAGYEFSNLIDSIVAVSTRRGAAQGGDQAALAGLTEDVTIKVFARPPDRIAPGPCAWRSTWRSPRTASGRECIEATEFPELSQRYQVMAVPKIVINDRSSSRAPSPSATSSPRSSRP